MTAHYRVAMVAACPFPASRGTPIRIHRIAEQLARRGHHVDVFTYHLGSNADGAPFKVHRIPDVKTYQKESPGPSYQKLLLLDSLLAFKLLRGLRRERYDVIHAHHAEGLLSALPARLFMRVPIVFDAHTLLESELPYYGLGLPKRLLQRIGTAMDVWLPGRADHVIAVSEEIRAALIARRRGDENRIAVIPNGVEAEFWKEHAAAERLDGGPTVVYAGTLAAYQRIDLLLRAFAKAHSRMPKLRLMIYTHSDFQPFEGMARELRIAESISVTTPSLEDLPSRLGAADVAVNPRTECTGMPQKLGNYMAAGCPIVTFAGSAKHVVHERTGLIVADGDVDAMAAAILRLIADRQMAQQLGMQARAFAREELGWPRVAERIENVYALVTRTAVDPTGSRISRP